MPNELDAKFWRACDILRRDDNTQSLLDYVEQISWLLFLKSHEDQEDTRADEAEYAGQPYQRVIDGYYRWSVWTGGRIEQARQAHLDAQAELRAAQKDLVKQESALLKNEAALLKNETAPLKDENAVDAAHRTVEAAEQRVQIAAERTETERILQRQALQPLLDSTEEDDRAMAEAILGGLTGKALIRFLSEILFPHLRELPGDEERGVIRQIFEEAPSKMLKSGFILRDAIAVVDTIDFHAPDNVHTLSHLYESLLVRMGREGGMSGEFYTPRPIIQFMVEMVDPRLGETVYDPACGSAGFLVEAYAHMLANQVERTAQFRKLRDATFFGQEKKPLPYLLGVMNTVLHEIPVPHIVRKNTLSDDIRKYSEKERYHVILTNPPFGGTENIDAVKANFPYPSSATSILFMQHIMHRLRRDGRVGMVIDEGVLFKSSERAYLDTKKELLEEFNLYAIVSLPAGVFANVVSSGTGPKTDLLFFDHLGPTRQVWYYEVSAVGFSLTKTQKPVTQNDLPDCLAMWKAYDAWRRLPPDQRDPEPPQNERCWIVPVAEIIQKNYDLSANNPKRQNGFAHRPPEELIADIADKQARISELIVEIQELLAGDTNG
ncbi:MAG TPA: N-6 DNA methylase [Bellilinea sp.]|nr:N-6 DNA methylase [Bellilinea sp.]